jgi:hypothetical protein
VRFGLPALAPGLQLPLARFFFALQLVSTSAYRVLIGCWSMMTDIPYYYPAGAEIQSLITMICGSI